MTGRIVVRDTSVLKLMLLDTDAVSTSSFSILYSIPSCLVHNRLANSFLAMIFAFDVHL